MFRKLVAASAAALLLLLTGATSAVAAPKGTDRPFRATASGEIVNAENSLGCTVGYTSVVTAAGQGTHLGTFQLTARHCEVATSPVAGKSVNGEMTLVAANGDKIIGTYETDWVFNPATFTVTVTGDLQIIGGTGRFTNATGTLSQHHVITVTQPQPPWPLQMGFEGLLSY
jgi:hypothetical protein